MKQASQKLSISKEEIRACYAQGEEAVIVLVESLVARINALEARMEVLENQKSKDSKNSSKPSELFGAGRGTRLAGKLPPKTSRTISRWICEKNKQPSHQEWS